MQFQHYTALMLQAIPGGYVKGDRVKSCIEHRDSNGHLKEGDIGTVRVRHPRCSKQLSSTLSLSLSLYNAIRASVLQMPLKRSVVVWFQFVVITIAPLDTVRIFRA